MHAVGTAYGGRRFRGKSAKMRCQLEWTVALHMARNRVAEMPMPTDRYAKTNAARRGARDIGDLLREVGLGGTDAKMVCDRAHDLEACRRLAARVDCNPNYRRVLLELYVPWLLEHEAHTLTTYARGRVVQCLKLAAAVDRGYKLNRPLGPSATVEATRAYYAEAERKKLAARSDWMRDRSLLPKKPPGR